MERRSSFRFRLPWSQPESEPASKPSTQPNSTKTGTSNRTTRQVTRSRTAASQPSSSTTPKTNPSSSPTTENTTPKQPPSTTTTATSRKPSSSSAGTQGRNEVPASTNTSAPRSPQPRNSAETKAPAESQPTTTSTSTSVLAETPVIPPQPSAESKAPIQSSTTNTKPTNAPASPETETRTPVTTITTTPKQSPQSSPPGVAPSSTESQPLIPSQEQQGITSQPASPSDVATKSRASLSPSPSPSRSAPQSRDRTPKSSPTRKGPQVPSTDQLTPKGQTSSNPLDITSQMQPKDQTISQPTSPLKQSQESSETSSKSAEKQPMSITVLPQSEQKELPKKEEISDTSAKTKDRSPEKVMQQPSELSEVKSTRGITEGPSKISDSSRTISEPREVKEVVQETKEQPGIVFQSKQANSDDDQIQVNRVSNGKQTRSISSQLKNRTLLSGSKETTGSAEHDIPLNKEVKDNISKFIHRMTVGDGKKNLEEGPVSVITLAGDNRGASMQLGSDSSKKGRAVHIRRGYKLNPDETTDAEGTSEGRQPKDERTMKDQGIEAYMNCNVQGLNNSITFDSSIEGKNPGIHMSFPRMPSELTKSSEKTGVFEAHKAEYNVTRAQKHTYKPTSKRRCVEALFFEPNDSDTDSDNPEEPRRHGMEKRDNEINIL